MRVYNLTDVPTPALQQRNLVNRHLVVGNRMSNPGEYVDVEDTPSMRARLRSVVELGALALDTLPPRYVMQRQRASQAAGVSPVQHLDIQETKTVEVPQAAASLAAQAAPPVVLQKLAAEVSATAVAEVESPGPVTSAADSGKAKRKGRR